MINNVLYVIILSAALDLVGPDVPKGVVLLADVIPSFLTKLCAPYFIHTIPYSGRILIFVALSVMGMLFIALTPGYSDGGTITAKMAGVMLASLSSGGGELSFLGLVHYYGPFSLAAWGSGTGGAGLIGAGAYAIATTSLGLGVRTTLLASACLPVVMLISFFLILPLGPLRTHTKKHQDSLIEDVENEDIEQEQRQGLLSTPDGTKPAFTSKHGRPSVWVAFKHNLRRARGLFFPLHAAIAACVCGRIHHQPGRSTDAPVSLERISVQALPGILSDLQCNLPGRGFYIEIFDTVSANPQPLPTFILAGGQSGLVSIARNLQLRSKRLHYLRYHILGRAIGWSGLCQYFCRNQ